MQVELEEYLGVKGRSASPRLLEPGMAKTHRLDIQAFDELVQKANLVVRSQQRIQGGGYQVELVARLTLYILHDTKL